MSYDVMGDDVLGELMGEDDELDGWATVGAAKRRRKRRMALPKKPSWRRQLAPGVPAPGQGLQPLPLTPDVAGGVFVAAVPTIRFTARPQVPFRAERLIATVRRSAGAGAPIVLADGIFIGRDQQLIELGSFDVEQFSPTAFGVRLALDAAQPGVLIQIPLRTSIAVPGADTISVALMFLGRSIR
jgi:hypothetical protein